MNAKQALLVAAALLAATSGYAVEATQFVPDAPHAARTEVKADGRFVAAQETYGQASVPARSERDRAEVRAEARVAARNHTPNSLYFGG